jgi:hypothetical protein
VGDRIKPEVEVGHNDDSEIEVGSLDEDGRGWMNGIRMYKAKGVEMRWVKYPVDDADLTIQSPAAGEGGKLACS